MGRDRFERDMSDEIAFHVDARTADLIRSGVPEDEARRRARVEFGGVEGWKERCRETRSFRPLDELRADLRYGIRALAKSPGFAIAAMLSLAIGIGVNTAIFSLIDAMWLRPMAVPDEGRVTRLFTTSPEDSQDMFSWPEFQEFSRQSRTFTGIVALGSRGARMQRPDGTFEMLFINTVSTNFFSTLGVRPAVGRLFTPADEPSLTEHPVVALSYDFWRRHYGGDPSIVGRQIRLEGTHGGQAFLTVCGILPEGFRGLEASGDRDIWMPPQTFAVLRGHGDFEARGFRWFNLVGRIRPGVSVRTASAEAATIAARLAANWPETNRGRSARSISDLAYRIQQTRGPGMIFFAVVLLVLIMSAVNVANLLIARAAARTRELSIRVAVGAGRGRVMRQMFTESALLGGGGLAAGLLLGWTFIRALPSMIGGVPGYRMALFHAGLDMRVFLFAAALALATTLAFSLAPAITASRADVNSLLKQAINDRRRRFRTRQALIGAQVALSLTLLALAAVLAASFVRTRTADIGIARREQLLLWGGGTHNQVREAAAHLQAIAGVQEVALAIRAPLSTDEGGMAMRVSFPGRPDIDKAAPLEIKYNAISSNFLRVMGTPVVRGRDFNETDQTTGPPTVLISETMASKYWPGEDAVGKTIRLGNPPGVEYRIAGIVRNVQFNTIDQRPEPYMYLPWFHGDFGEVTFIVWTRQSAASLADTARKTLIAVDTRLDPFTVTTEGALIRFSALQYQLTAELLAILGFIGLALTAIGLYGVVAWSVTRRTREIGIRMALGASRRETLGLVLRQTAMVGGIGMLAGVPLALAATKAASSMLYGTSPWDAGMLASAVAVLAAVLLAAGFIPARRATRIDPLAALRVE